MAETEVALSKLPFCRFQELEEILTKHIPQSLLILGCLQQMKRSLKVMNGHVYVSQWPHPDIVVFENVAYKKLVESKFPPVLIFASCCTEKLRMAIEKSHFKELFTNLSEITGDVRCCEIAHEYSQLHNCQIKVLVTLNICALIEPSKLVKFECPPGYYIAPLKPVDAQLVDRTWKFGGKSWVVERMTKLATHSLTAGVYWQPTNELVSWAFVMEYGSIGVLNTLPPHRMKGLAKALIYHLAKTLLEQGQTVFSLIEKDNDISIQLFSKMGFTLFSDRSVVFLQVFPKSD